MTTGQDDPLSYTLSHVHTAKVIQRLLCNNVSRPAATTTSYPPIQRHSLESEWQKANGSSGSYISHYLISSGGRLVSVLGCLLCCCRIHIICVCVGVHVYLRSLGIETYVCELWPTLIAV